MVAVAACGLVLAPVVLTFHLGETDLIVTALVASDVLRRRDGGILQGVGSDNPASEDDYAGNRCVTYRGRGLAVVRPTGVGLIAIRAESGDFATDLIITAKEPQ